MACIRIPASLIPVFALASAACGPADDPGAPPRNGTILAEVQDDDPPPFLLPYPNGVVYRCSQGPGNAFSHNGASTLHDLDFDTPNDRQEPVVAPSSGTAYVHPDGGKKSFGNHVAIDLGGGLFDLVAHLSAFDVADGQPVVVGQRIGWEGTTGFSTGDHIHAGRHQGDPTKDALGSVSVPIDRIIARDVTVGGKFREFRSDEFVCSLGASCTDPSGHCYESNNGVTRHPTGTLLKEPGEPEVYLVTAPGEIRWIKDEKTFYSRRLYHDPGDPWGRLVEATSREIGCYARGPDIDWPVSMKLARCRLTTFSSETVVTLVTDDKGTHTRRPAPVPEGTASFKALLRSWGFSPADIQDEWQPCGPLDAPLALRDGTVTQESADPKFRVIADDGLAYRLEPALAWAMRVKPSQVIQLPSGATLDLIRGVDQTHREWTRDDAAACASPPPPDPGDGAGKGGGGCADADGDGATDAACGGADCDDADPGTHPGAAETCDGEDDDCDGVADEGFPLDWDTANCGKCGVSCYRPHAVSFCLKGACSWSGCDTGWADKNGAWDDGCEAAADPPAVPAPDAGAPDADGGAPPGPPACGHAVRYRFDGYAGDWQFGADTNAGWYVSVLGALDKTVPCVPAGWHVANGQVPGPHWLCEEWPLGSFSQPYGQLMVDVDGAPVAVVPWHDPSIPGGIGCNLRFCVGGGCP